MEPDWMKIARGELGTHETAGKKATPRIVEYFKAAGSPVVSDEIAWCSAFVNWVMEQAGHRGTHSLSARSWLTWGQSAKPQPGAVMVFKRGSDWQGHVCFYIGETRSHYRVIGGNQGNKVSETTIPKARFLDARMPFAAAKSRTVQASTVGGVAAAATVAAPAATPVAKFMGAIQEHGHEALEQAQSLTDTISWMAYAAAALGLLCFLAVIYFRLQDAREKGR
jgi:uncharacterized protein (TIGR02594 family)